MKNLMLGLAALGVALGALSVLAQSAYPVRFEERHAADDKALAVEVDAIQLTAVRWVSRDSPPFSCLSSRVGYVYLQRDVVNFTQPSHVLCICRTTDIPATGVYEWQMVGGGLACADLY